MRDEHPQENALKVKAWIAAVTLTMLYSFLWWDTGVKVAAITSSLDDGNKTALKNLEYNDEQLMLLRKISDDLEEIKRVKTASNKESGVLRRDALNQLVELHSKLRANKVVADKLLETLREQQCLISRP